MNLGGYVNPAEFWTDARHNKEFSNLALVASRFVLLASSEASAERIFSRKRNILTDHHSNASTRYAHNRMQFRDAKKLLKLMGKPFDIDQMTL